MSIFDTHMIILCQARPGTAGRCNEQDIRSSPDYEVHTGAAKFRIHKCHAALWEADDVLYSPNKYRETEGIKENKRNFGKTDAKALV